MKSPFKKKGSPAAEGMDAFIVDASAEKPKGLLKRLTDREKPDKEKSEKKQSEDKPKREKRESKSFSLPKMPKRGGGRKHTVVLLDGDRTAVVTAKGRTIVSAEELKHDTPEAAAAAARKTAGRKPVVWHSKRQSFTQSDAPQAILHPKAEAVWALGIQQSIFRPHEPAAFLTASDGKRCWLALTSSNQPKWADGGAVAGGFAVGNQDGAWLRVGWDAAEMSLVVNGKFTSWAHLGDGIADLERQLEEMVPTGQRGNESQRALTSDYYSGLLAAVDTALSGWQQQGLSAKRIWVHGPGLEAPQELIQQLAAGTGLVVETPALQDWEYPPTNHSWLPSAIAAIEGDLPLWRSVASVQKKQRIKKLSVRFGLIAAVVILFGSMWYISKSEGDGIKSRMADAQEREATAQQIIAANEALAQSEVELEANAKLATLTSMEEALERVIGVDTSEVSPEDEAELRAAALFSDMADWESLFQFWELWFYAPKGQSEMHEVGDNTLELESALNFSLSGGNWTFRFPDSSISVEGNLGLRSVMDAWAAMVWGDCAATVGGPSISVNPNGLTDLAIAVEPVIPCLLERLAEIEAEQAAQPEEGTE